MLKRSRVSIWQRKNVPSVSEIWRCSHCGRADRMLMFRAFNAAFAASGLRVCDLAKKLGIREPSVHRMRKRPMFFRADTMRRILNAFALPEVELVALGRASTETTVENLTKYKPCWTCICGGFDTYKAFRAIRVALFLTGIWASELAEKIGLTRQAVSLWYRGRSAPTPETLGKVADALGFTEEELAFLGRKDIKEVIQEALAKF